MKLHDYQEYAVKFIEEHKIAALLLGHGLGLTKLLQPLLPLTI